MSESLAVQDSKLLVSSDGKSLCTTCCDTPPPPLGPCQWTAVFTYSESTCAWEVTTEPVVVRAASADLLHDPGDFCAEGTHLVISRYGPKQEDGNCASMPDDFATPPTADVYYIVCDEYWSGPDCTGTVMGRAPQGVTMHTGAGCPATVTLAPSPPDYTWPLSDTGECKNRDVPGILSAKVTKLAGPFCSAASADAWATDPSHIVLCMS